MLTTGEKLWNGATVTASLAAAYNSIQGRIASFQEAGKPVPEQLLNGSHSLIASALADDPDAITHLRALDVPAMMRADIFEMREAIATLIIRARFDYRELQDHQETRARGWIAREYVESIADILASVTRP